MLDEGGISSTKEYLPLSEPDIGVKTAMTYLKSAIDPRDAFVVVGWTTKNECLRWRAKESSLSDGR
jgi:hypothetical protein